MPKAHFIWREYGPYDTIPCWNLIDTVVLERPWTYVPFYKSLYPDKEVDWSEDHPDWIAKYVIKP